MYGFMYHPKDVAIMVKLSHLRTQLLSRVGLEPIHSADQIIINSTFPLVIYLDVLNVICLVCGNTMRIYLFAGWIMFC